MLYLINLFSIWFCPDGFKNRSRYWSWWNLLHNMNFINRYKWYSMGLQLSFVGKFSMFLKDTDSYTWLFFSYNHSYSLSVQLCSCLSINAATWLALLVCTSSLFERVQVKWVIMKNCSPLPTVGQQLSNRPLNFYMQLMIDNWYTQ